MTYISLDIDYFQYLDCELEEKLSAMKNWLAVIMDSGKTVFIAWHHHRLLEQIKDKKFDHIINFDTHSDLVGNTGVDSIDELGSHEERIATWLNFYPHKKDCILTWAYPDQKYCMRYKQGLIIWQDGIESWNYSKRRCGYKKVLSHQGSLDEIDWDDVVEVGIAISEDFVGDNALLRYFYYAVGEIYTPIRGYYNIIWDSQKEKL